MSELPQAESADTDAVQMALQAAQTLWSRGDTTESLRWLRRAAESASDEGADLRSLQLAKAAAELRAKLFPSASEAPPAMSARVPTQRDLSGVRPLTSEMRGEEDAVASGAMSSAPSAGTSSPGMSSPGMSSPGMSSPGMSSPGMSSPGMSSPGMSSPGMTSPSLTSPSLAPSDAKPGPLSEESSPGASRSPSSVPQYVVHRPREQQRQLMGLSSSTLETARQQNGAAASYASVPSWSAGSERRTSAPPPLPHSIDDYEELDAEPIHDSDENATAAWAGTAAPTWRPPERGASAYGTEARREAGSDSSPRVATLPPPSFQPSALSSMPPPLPELSAFGDDDGDPMRPEQPTVVLPPLEEQGPDPSFFTDPSSFGANPWGAAGAAEPSAAEPAPAKLRARVHHQAVRVAFAPDARAPGQYVVRPLREGERAPAGERVALLVALEPGVPLV